MIDGKTKIVGLIGSNIEHSLSYCMHNFAFKQKSLNAVYVPFCVSQSDLINISHVLRSPSFVGANVTLPYKKNILSFLDQLDPQAKRIGAVNTIIKDNDGTLIGKNSDAPGFISALKEAKLPYIDRDVLLLGAGGAAWAIADALSGLGKRCIHIYNRTTSKAQRLIEHLLKH